MRLDEYLLKRGVRCKETADHLIKRCMVLVNGKPVTYPSLPVEESDKIEILKEEYKDAPASFWKLKEIDKDMKLIQTGDFVLCVESPDGGFPLYAAREEANVTLVTVRDDLDFLKKEGVEIKKKNLLREDPKKFLSSKFDTVIIEIGLDIMKSIQLVEKMREFVGSRGKLIMFVPEKGRENAREMIENMLLNQKLGVVDFFETRKGFYVYAKVV
ncbi:MAG: hypothetical protein JSV92_00265 [archaeon]|nr:MAG: hypothetical protein JSV92_00265 [archaeon]